MTALDLAYWNGLAKTASAAAQIARRARRAGDLKKFRKYARQAEALYEEARIERGDVDALLDRAERVAEQMFLEERRREDLQAFCRAEARREVLQAGLASLQKRAA